MYFITLLRHGESEGNLAGLIQGQSDYPLTSTGIEQAHRLAKQWKSMGVHFDHIISSPLQRASHTAEIISSYLNIPIDFDPAWKERNFGLLQDQRLEEIIQRVPPVDFFHPYEAIGVNGESQNELFTRAGEALLNILHRSVGSYLIVSHGGILNKALYVIMGITPSSHHYSPIFHFENTGYAQFRYNPSSQQWAVINLNNQAADSQSEGDHFWKID